MTGRGDVITFNAGSVVLFDLLTPEAFAWVDEHVGGDRLMIGNSLAVEPRYAEALATGMRDDGLTVQAVWS